MQKQLRDSEKMGSIRSIIIKKALEPFLKALIDDTIKGILRSIGDAGDAPTNITGRTILAHLDEIRSYCWLLRERRSARAEKGTLVAASLGANATFTSGWYDYEYYLNARLMYLCYADVDGAMYSEWSLDTVTIIREDSLSYIGRSKTGNLIDTRILARYARVRYVNGAAAATTFIITWARSD